MTINPLSRGTNQQIHLILLYDNIFQSFDDSLLAGTILIDLQKEFDTINHDILLQKLGITGFCDDAVK